MHGLRAPAALRVATQARTATKLNKFSSRITQPESQGASQAMLHAIGMGRDDMNKAQVGIASMWYEGNPCNKHLLDLGKLVKKGVEDAGLVGLQFNTIGVSDGMSMGTSGMSFSLQSRDIIADSIETVMCGQWYDANISIPGCDKNMPGCLIAMARVDRPALMVYGGSIRAGCSSKGAPLDIVSAFQAYGQKVSGLIEEEERLDIIANSCPGVGACGGMYTANTMASAIEAMGMSLPNSSSMPADSQEKADECHQAGAAIRNMLEKQIIPSMIMTKAAFENAMVTVMALGGSTNAVLHLIAMGRAVGVDLTIDDFQRVSDYTPFIADLKPSGAYTMEDLYYVGGVPAVLKYLMAEKFIDGSCLTVTGNTLQQNLDEMPGLKDGQEIIMPLSSPIKETGHLTIFRGNIAKDGSVAKITGKEGLSFNGTALVYDCEEDMLEALENGGIHAGVAAGHENGGQGAVIIIRYEGPQGGPGMPEMLTPTSAIVGANLHMDVALLTDGRFSGGSHGFIIGHITPEAQVGGTIALVENGDAVEINYDTKEINVMVSDEVLAARMAEWEAPPLKVTRGTLHRYIKTVKTASEGCVTDE